MNEKFSWMHVKSVPKVRLDAKTENLTRLRVDWKAFLKNLLFFCNFSEQKKMMEKTSEAAESERTRLIDLTKNLELKLSSLEQVGS